MSYIDQKKELRIKKIIVIWQMIKKLLFEQ